MTRKAKIRRKTKETTHSVLKVIVNLDWQGIAIGEVIKRSKPKRIFGSHA